MSGRETGPAREEGSRGPGAGEASPEDGSGAGESITLLEAQAIVDEWISQFEEGYWPPLANLARLTEEVGELAREMNHRFGHKPKKADEPERELAIELADVLFVLIVIANERGIDLDEALLRVLDKYRTRDGERWRRAGEG